MDESTAVTKNKEVVDLALTKDFVVDENKMEENPDEPIYKDKVNSAGIFYGILCALSYSLT